MSQEKPEFQPGGPLESLPTVTKMNVLAEGSENHPAGPPKSSLAKNGKHVVLRVPEQHSAGPSREQGKADDSRHKNKANPARI
jgi:hypothetical protein